jgi:hypothetical protein
VAVVLSVAMSDLLNPNPAPQFSIAEFGNPSNADICKMCQKPITATYYRANGAMVCDSCADRVRRGRPQDSHAAFVKAVLFGLGGFVAGLIAYAGFSIVTGIQIGYLSLAVGWMIGKAMMIGSGNIGGRRYQIAAVVLTYAAVSMAAIPIALLYHPQTGQTQTTNQSGATANQDAPTQYAQSTDEPAAKTGDEPSHRSAIATLLIALGKLALIGLASPFLEVAEGVGGVIGLIILFVGMQFAWKMTASKATLSVEGPYQVSPPAASGASA